MRNEDMGLQIRILLALVCLTAACLPGCRRTDYSKPTSEDIPALVRELWREESSASEPAGLELLIQILGRNDSQRFLKLADALGTLVSSDPRNLEVVIDLLDDDDPEMRTGSAFALRMLINLSYIVPPDETAVVEALCRRLRDENDANVRYEVARDVCSIVDSLRLHYAKTFEEKTEGIVTTLVEVVLDPNVDQDTQEEAYRGLTRIGTVAHIDTVVATCLETLLSDDLHHWGALDTLFVLIGENIASDAGEVDEVIPEIVRAVSGVLDDKEEKVRLGAIAILRESEPYSEAALGDLANALDDESPMVRVNAARAVFGLTSEAEAVVPVLIDVLENSHYRYYGPICSYSSSLLGPFPVVNSSAPSAAAYVLGTIGPDASEAIPVLIEVFRSDRPSDLRRDAGRAIGDIGYPDDYVPMLIDMLADEDPARRADAASALGFLGEGARDALPTLRGMLGDPVREVRGIVRDAIARIEGSIAEEE